MRSLALVSSMLLLSFSATSQREDSRPSVASTPSSAVAASGEFISWHEHIIDDTAVSNTPISGSDGLVMGDLDGDGYLDIVSVHESDTEYDGVADGYIRIAFGSDDPDRWVNVTLAQGAEAGAPEDAAIGDFNGDGHLDIIAACELAHLIYFQNPGKDARNATWERVIPPLTLNRGSFIRVFAADFNGDGKPEAVAPNKGEQNPSAGTSATKPISIYEIPDDPLDGARWKEHVLGESRIPQNSRPIDLDGDGDLDVVGGSRGENRIMWFENLGTTEFAFREHAIEVDGGEGGGFNLAFEDLNRDGRLDIVLMTGPALGRGLVWIEQPERLTEPWIHHAIGGILPDSLVGFVLADINGDGKSDILCGSYSRGPRDKDGNVPLDSPLGRIAWFEQPNSVTAPWARHDISRRKRGMFDKFIPRDMDNDGDIDFVGTRGNSNPYDGVFWLEQVRTKAPAPAFTKARTLDSAEVALPASRD